MNTQTEKKTMDVRVLGSNGEVSVQKSMMLSNQGKNLWARNDSMMCQVVENYGVWQRRARLLCTGAIGLISIILILFSLIGIPLGILCGMIKIFYPGKRRQDVNIKKDKIS